jgi:transposase
MRTTQVELGWDRAGRRCTWHITLDEGIEPAPAAGDAVVAADLGEMHPAALTGGQEAVVITVRRLRAARQYTAKGLAELRPHQDREHKGSRRWKRVQRRKNRFRAQQQKRTRDSEQKVSRAVVEYAAERTAGTLASGDVRAVADGTHRLAKTQQKIGLRSA